jgi:hypothetical protein
LSCLTPTPSKGEGVKKRHKINSLALFKVLSFGEDLGEAES